MSYSELHICLAVHFAGSFFHASAIVNSCMEFRCAVRMCNEKGYFCCCKPLHAGTCSSWTDVLCSKYFLNSVDFPSGFIYNFSIFLFAF